MNFLTPNQRCVCDALIEVNMSGRNGTELICARHWHFDEDNYTSVLLEGDDIDDNASPFGKAMRP